MQGGKRREKLDSNEEMRKNRLGMGSYNTISLFIDKG